MLKFAIITLVLACQASAEPLLLNIQSAPEYALAHNKQLAAARLRIEEARGRLLGSGRLANPELEIEFAHNTRISERNLAISFMQKFPLTARLRLEKIVSRTQLAAAEAEVRDAGRKLAAEVRVNAVKLAALRAQGELRNEQLAVIHEQAEFVKKRATVGEASSLDAAQLDLEAQQLKVDLLQLETARAALIGELGPLLGIPAGQTVEIAGALTVPSELPMKSANVEDRADLAAARLNAEAARLAVDVAKAQKWQDIGVGVMGSAGRTEDVPAGFSNDYFVGLRISVPLPLWNRNEGQIAEASAAAMRARREAEALAMSIRSEADAARSEMAALAKLVNEMDATLLPKAEQIEVQLRASYESGQSPLTEVMRARGRRLELTQHRLDALRDYHLARVRYDAAIGRGSEAH